MINRKHLAVLEDVNGLTVFALTGSLEYIIDSVKNSVNEFLSNDKEKESLKGFILGGSLVIIRNYLECVHDNDPVNNFAFAVDKKIVFPVEDLLKVDFSTKDYCVMFQHQLQDLKNVDDKLLFMFDKHKETKISKKGKKEDFENGNT